MSQAQENHRTFGKLSQKTFFGSKLGLNCYHGQRFIHKFSHSLQQDHPSILLRCRISAYGYLPFLTLARNHIAFWFRTHFCFLRGNISSQQRLIELKVWSKVVLYSCTNVISSILTNSSFYSDRTYQKFEFLVKLWPQFTP